VTRPSRKKGQAGEKRAAAWLSSRGWRIRERNFRTRRGEIDIIAEKGAEVAFVEVKAWDALPKSELEYSIDSRKQKRIMQAARFYVATNPEIADSRLRFDVIFLGGATAEVRHIERAFNGGID
jgi:putative endonuclease